MTETSDLPRFGLLDTDDEPCNNDMDPTPPHPEDYDLPATSNLCDSCGAFATRPNPFSTWAMTCEDCFVILIGGEPGDPHFKCGNA